jgi:superfamily II DNA or RNA helicase
VFKLRNHQSQAIADIFTKFETNNKVLYQLSTGGGKTLVFSFLIKEWIARHGGKVLILVHREELVEQTYLSLLKIGVFAEKITSKVKQPNHNGDSYVAMVETAYNRLQKDPNFFRDVTLVIADEAHILVFEKVFSQFQQAKILGCTATPIVLKKITFFRCKHCKNDYNTLVECCGDEVAEWTKPFTMSQIFDDIVVGASVNQLIDDGTLIEEISLVKPIANLSNLKVDSATGDYTTTSMTDAYSKDESLFNVILNYEEFAKGQKTMIFNSTTAVNKLLYEKFIEAGYNAKMYDSINNDASERKAVVEWFKNTPDAVLLNVSVFTTGFDVTDVQAIILNRPTKSLSLFLQMVGRGARPTDKIFKDKFLVIDGGNNIDTHGEWSDPSRDWKDIFFNGNEKEKPKKEQVDDIQSCPNCAALFLKTAKVCPECNFEILPMPKIASEGKISNEILKPIREIPPPNPEKIFQYTLQKNEDLNFAWKIMESQIVDLFRYYRVNKQLFESTKQNGKLQKRVKRLVQNCYFVLIDKPLDRGTNRTLNYLYQRTLSKIESYYQNK